MALRRVICLLVLLPGVNSASYHYCTDFSGKRHGMGEEWVEGRKMCMCVSPEELYGGEGPPVTEYSPPEPFCRDLGCVDRYTDEFKLPGDRMFNHALGTICHCVEGRDPYMMDLAFPDLYHWQCSGSP
ncbi:uncharacterized protein LOC135469089 [Liolophura sinensis]|uniref:uncharacterized protein LOC135469089 n=1 Tax=Liolophura sinensis TaxID=3198878 RepID=UPI00315838B8